jgi:AraC family transcriptional regulator, transcriptional activator of pobA
VQATRGEIRAERLEDRISPRVPFPHKHDFYQIVVITKGRGWHQIDFQRYKLTHGQIFFIKPGQVHGWEMSPTAQGYILEFTSESFAKSLDSNTLIHSRLSNLSDLILCPAKIKSRFMDQCEVMCGEFGKKEWARESSLQSWLNLILITLYRLDSNENRGAKENDDAIEKFEVLVEENFRQEHRVEFYAEKLKLSSRALTMRLSRALDRSARDLIQDRCLLEARRLLAYSNQPISQISDLLGFQDPNYFSRIFKSKTGLTPAKFRERAAGKI